jgi:hypothetical protein
MDYLIDAKQNIIINPKSNMKEVKSKNEKKKKTNLLVFRFGR